jgi:hypothetical protein
MKTSGNTIPIAGRKSGGGHGITQAFRSIWFTRGALHRVGSNSIAWKFPGRTP